MVKRSVSFDCVTVREFLPVIGDLAQLVALVS
jgi:hypothetical protein